MKYDTQEVFFKLFVVIYVGDMNFNKFIGLVILFFFSSISLSAQNKLITSLEGLYGMSDPGNFSQLMDQLEAGHKERAMQDILAIGEVELAIDSLLEHKTPATAQHFLIQTKEAYHSSGHYDSIPHLTGLMIKVWSKLYSDRVMKDSIARWQHYLDELPLDITAQSIFFSKLAEYHALAGNIERSLEADLKALNLAERKEFTDTMMKARVIGNVGVGYYFMGDFDKAEAFTKRNYDLVSAYSGATVNERLMAGLNLAGIYGMVHKTELGIQINTELLEMITQNEEQLHPYYLYEGKGTIYHNLGGSYSNQGNEIKSKEYLEKAADTYYQVLLDSSEIRDAMTESDIIRFRQSYYLTQMNLALSHYTMGNLRRSGIIFKKIGEEMRQRQDTLHQEYQMSLVNYARILIEEEKLNEAKEYIERINPGLIEGKDYLSQYHTLLSQYYLTQGDCEQVAEHARKSIEFLESGSILTYGNIKSLILPAKCYQPLDADKALHYLNRAIATAQQMEYKDHLLAYLSSGKAAVYLENEQYQAARDELEKAAVFFSARKEIYVEKPELLLYLTLNSKLNHLQYPDSEKEQLKALQFILEAADIIKSSLKTGYKTINGSTSEELIEEIKSLGLRIYLRLHEISGEEKYIQALMVYRDRFNQIMINDKLNKLQAVSFANVPAEVVYREQQLLMEIKNFQENEEANNQQLLDASQQYESFIDSIQTAFPKYYQFRYGLDKITFDDIRRNLLSENRELVQYQYINGELYVILVNREHSKVIKLRNSNYGETISSLNRALRNGDFSQIKSLSEDLYGNLIQPIEPYLKAERILVMPDGPLFSLSFEMLTRPSASGSFKTLDYLIHHYEFSYNYSYEASIRYQNMAHERNSRFIAFAPGFLYGERENDRNFGEHALVKQPFAVLNSKNIAKKLAGKYYINNYATKSNFTAKGREADLLHLATHTVYDENPSFSRIYFTPDSTDDGIMNAYEVYELELNADFVFLMSCESGVGKKVPSEGMVSLAYAFQYAGSQAIIATLWNVDETQSQEVAGKFYDFLESGHTLSGSLKKAKLAYLKETTVDELASPYYWAGLIVQGDADQKNIIRHKKDYLMIVLLLLLLSGIGFYWFRYK